MLGELDVHLGSFLVLEEPQAWGGLHVALCWPVGARCVAAPLSLLMRYFLVSEVQWEMLQAYSLCLF